MTVNSASASERCVCGAGLEVKLIARHAVSKVRELVTMFWMEHHGEGHGGTKEELERRLKDIEAKRE